MFLFLFQQLVCGLLFSWLLTRPSSAAHPKSPCPGVFAYEGSEPVNNRWYAVISLRSDEMLMGVRLDVDLDRHAELIVVRICVSASHSYIVCDEVMVLSTGTGVERMIGEV